MTDLLDNPLEVGDIVILARARNKDLCFGKIDSLKITARQEKIVFFPCDRYGAIVGYIKKHNLTTKRDPKKCIKLKK